MEKLIKTFLVLLISTFVFTSCGDDKKAGKIHTALNDKDSISKSDSLIVVEPPVAVSTIKIGQQEWMTDDINTVVYNNGDAINEAKSENQWKEYNSKQLGCFRKLNNGTHVYNGYAINDQRGILPSGFVLPTNIQFNQLIKFLGGGDFQTGKAVKTMVTYPIHIEEWVGDQETGGLDFVEIKTNGSSGFNAKKGGFIYDQGSVNEGECSYWWTASSEQKNTIVVDIGYCSQDLGGGYGSYPKTYGFAVRAIKK